VHSFKNCDALDMLEFHIFTTKDQIDNLSDQLALLGAVAVTWQDAANEPIYEPMPGEIVQWHETVIIALFEDHAAQPAISDYLCTQQEQGFLTSFQLKDVPKQDWVRVSLDQFKPTLFGKRLWICPSWHTPPDPHAINVLLDPGLAFGTGTHPTTALCLEWLDENIRGNETLIDYGCGSGILAVAALKLGAKHVIGVDHDPQALEACVMNAELNHLTSSLQVTLPEHFVMQQVDLVLANILAKTHIELAPLFANLIKPGGKLILSGILTTQSKEIIRVYGQQFAILHEELKEEWVRLECKRL
jgi:ribosomal protein L11 methyltransferase